MRERIVASANDLFVTAPRYALYFSPCASSAWARFGAQALSGDARRYGFHATLKAPFRLATGAGIAELIAELDSWCATQQTFVMPPLRVERIDGFSALVPARAEPRVDAIAAHCLERFDHFRAPPDDAELARRRRTPLSPRQEALLARWGYPHVLDEFRFHLSLTGAGEPFPRTCRLPAAPLLFDGVCIFEEREPGLPFQLLHRSRFRNRGRLIYVAGPSGAGKDSILAWASTRLGEGAPIMFARRTITRPTVRGGERHVPVSRAQFRTRLARGEFAMAWEANGHRYGIGEEIRVWLAQGLTVVVSGSREYLPQALREFPDLEIVHVTAPVELLRERLVTRRRERGAMIERRLRRATDFPLPGALVRAELVNDGDVASAGRRFLEYLR